MSETRHIAERASGGFFHASAKVGEPAKPILGTETVLEIGADRAGRRRAERKALCLTEHAIEVFLPAHVAGIADVQAAEMALIFIALTVANVYATRAGGKLKLSPNLSERGFASQADYENADRLLRVLQGKQGAVQGRLDGIVDDGLHIYMRSYLSMN